MSRVPAAVTLDDEGRLGLDLTQPPPGPTYLRLTADTSGVVGRPCVWLDRQAVAWEFGWRIAGLPFAHRGGYAVDICRDVDWWRAVLNGTPQPGDVTRVWVDSVWLIAHGVATPA